MNFEIFKKTYHSNYFLINFNDIFDNEIIDAYFSFLSTIYNEEQIENVLFEYNSFLLKLVNDESKKFDLAQIAKEAILKIKLKNKNKEQIENEIDILKNLFNLNFVDIKNILIEKYDDFSALFDKMPEFLNSGLDLNLSCLNFSDLDYRAFIFDENLELKPVEYFEKTKFEDLKGYKKQQKILYQNTKALIDGKKVNNILLYGDAGCGKSTSVRALLNEFKEIKIVQIFKNNLINLDKLYQILSKLPYKFIIFADDISFCEEDETFSTMKAVLEGAIVQCPLNCAIYATSNRRHLIRESFKSRAGDEIHLNDTINEFNSLSERFGINLLFQKPDNEEFKKIVIELAKDNNLEISQDELLQKAQRFALVKGSKSPRIARQLIDNLINCLDV